MSYDLVVIGGGPAGYVGAIRAAQLGKKVVCVERERAGGTCLNWGCIPTKSVLRSAEVYRLFQRAEEFGLSADNVRFDFAKIMQRSRNIADRMAKGIEFLFKNKKVDYLRGVARIVERGKVAVADSDGKEQVLETQHILLATGNASRSLPGLQVDGKKILTSREALALTQQPRSILIVGAGAIGIEFASFFNALGVPTTLLEILPRILPMEDEEISEHLLRSFERRGIEILTETKIEKAETSENSVKVLTSGKHSREIEAEVVLVAVGVQARLENIFEKGVEIETERGFVKTDERYQTSMPGVWAAGDVIGPPLLAHVASHEGEAAVEGMFLPERKPRKIEHFPACTYCLPEIASVGLTEQKAKEKGLSYKVGKFPYRACGRAVTTGETDGFVKLVISQSDEKILGAHIIGMEATELIAEVGMAISLGATADKLIETIHAHPTLAEMMADAAAVADGKAIHL
ncbi:MAG: dihydrolipoyl dehydrogenase [bacterium]